MKGKKISRRDFLKLAAGSSLSVLVASCAAASTPEADVQSTEVVSTPEPVLENVDIKFWHPFGGSREAIMQETIIDPFNSEHANIKAEQVIWTGDDRLEKFIAAVAAGTPPDVIMFRSQDVPAFSEQGTFLPLDDYIKNAGLNADEIFYPAEINARRFNGKTYGLPTVTAAGQVIAFYNVQRFEEAGYDPEKTLETWEDWNTAQNAFLDNSTDPPKWFGNVDLVPTTLSFWILLYLNGGTYISNDLKTATFNDARGVEAMQWIYDMTTAQADYADINPGGSLSEYIDVKRKRFASGQTAVYVDGSWAFAQLEAEYDIKLESYRVHPFVYNGANLPEYPGAPAQGGWGNALPAQGKNHDASWEFIKFSTTSPASLDFTLKQARPNPVKAFNADKAYFDANPYWDTVVKISETDQAIPVSTATAEINQILSDMQEQVMYGKQSVEEALAAAEADAQRVLDTAG